MLAQIIGGFVMICLGVMLLPSITQQTSAIAANISSDGSTSGFASSTLLGIIPVLFAICILGVAIAIVYNGLRGILGVGYNYYEDDEDDEDEPEEKSQKTQKPRKQTYLEYVKERREIERLMGS